LGTIFFLLNLVIYAVNLAMVTSRIYLYPRVVIQSFYDESEAIWFPVLLLGFSTIILGIVIYGIPKCGVGVTEFAVLTS